MSMPTSFINNFLVQESISLMFVALGLSILGFAYGKLKTKEALYMHRWAMGGAVILTIASTAIIMVPSLYYYYITPEIDVLGGFSVLQIIHSILGVPTLALAILFTFNRLPQPTKKWMQLTAALWITSIILGAIIYYTMPS
jgi:uncharacterized membrane protein YozB (DUF420 family)